MIWLIIIGLLCTICFEIGYAARRDYLRGDRPIRGPGIKAPGPTVCRRDWGTHQ